MREKSEGALTVDEPARRAASQQTCCKQKWTLSVTNLHPN